MDAKPQETFRFEDDCEDAISFYVFSRVLKKFTAQEASLYLFFTWKGSAVILIEGG